MVYLQSISDEIIQLFADQCQEKGESLYCYGPNGNWADEMYKSSLMEVHEKRCSSKTLTVSYSLRQPDEQFIERLVTAQKTAKELFL